MAFCTLWEQEERQLRGTVSGWHCVWLRCLPEALNSLSIFCRRVLLIPVSTHQTVSTGWSQGSSLGLPLKPVSSSLLPRDKFLPLQHLQFIRGTRTGTPKILSEKLSSYFQWLCSSLLVTVGWWTVRIVSHPSLIFTVSLLVLQDWLIKN